MNKLLIVAAKFYNDPTGGGGTVVKHLIDTLADDFEIDLILYRTPTQNVFKRPNLKTYFHPILYRKMNKFERRILNAECNLQFIKENFDLESYQKIIFVHASKMFGVDSLDSSILNKTVLFPMFLSPSYSRSGEIPPLRYTELERKALNCASQIITPSQSEKDDLVQFFEVDSAKIKVIERGIDSVFFSNPKLEIGKPLKLITVSSIKPQKNVIESLVILNKLLFEKQDAFLTIIGKVESTFLMEEMQHYIDKYNLSSRVKMVDGLPIDAVSDEMKKSDFLLLPSIWETFGRVVYEGLASGLPALIHSGIDCFSELSTHSFILPYKSIDEAATSVIALINDVGRYRAESSKAVQFARNYSSEIEKKQIKEVILWQD